MDLEKQGIMPKCRKILKGIQKDKEVRKDGDFRRRDPHDLCYRRDRFTSDYSV